MISTLTSRKLLLVLISILGFYSSIYAQRHEFQLNNNWKFAKGDIPKANTINFDDKNWQTVSIPHDWAIYGPFDRNNDLQKTAVIQNGESVATVKTGRTGGLPYVGVGWYRTIFDLNKFDKEKQTATLIFDGAMSEAQVFVNGQKAIFWPYGYNSFYCDVTSLINNDGKANQLAVRLENKPESSRWYSGAGLYRNVHVVMTDRVHVPVWGTYLTTPFVSNEYASVRLKTTVDNVATDDVRILTEILDEKGNVVSSKDNTSKIYHDVPFEQNFIVNHPNLWSPETPYLYTATSKIYVKGELKDTYSTRFGIRSIQFIADKGFFLNGKNRKLQGVCLHHDLGPLGAAVNVAAIRRQLTILKKMGCDAIRTSHNMPAPELVQLCNEMGFMMIIEPFDEWDIAKCKNGYHRFFDQWAEKDMVNMLHHYRNDPSVIMWSIGNEVPSQWSPEGYKTASFLQNICHREDSTRPVTCGMDQVSNVLNNGFAALLDIPGFNYRYYRYQESYQKLPQNLILGTETSSTVSSRGIYKFPVEKKADAIYKDHQSSSYDMEYCSWSNIPDDDLALVEDHDWDIGQFVWSGFDYLGEPSPYDTDAWPSHSSLFGIVDLAGIPKDRFYLYKSVWNKSENTLHILPHWTWPGREGKVTPVFVYTNYPSAELFINGKSYGKQYKNDSTVCNRFRLMWMNAVYEPGTVKVVAYDKNGKAVAETEEKTAGKPYRIVLTADRDTLNSDGKDISFINVKMVDKNGTFCPTQTNEIFINVKGAGVYKAMANGDPADITSFQSPKMKLFSGQLTALVQSADKHGVITVTASARGIKSAKIEVLVK